MGGSITLKALSGGGPLARLINEKLQVPEARRLRFFSQFFAPFHLKDLVITSVDGRKVDIDGREAINFASCNYLGLDQDSRVLTAAAQALFGYGNHTGCSRIFASHANVIDLERAISDLVGAEKTMVGINTSQTHQGVIPALFSSSETEIFIDRYAHTSLYQASLTAKAKGAKITKVDVLKREELRLALMTSTYSHKVLLVDGMYSMSGEVPDLKGLQHLTLELDTILYIDDAHGIGILGDRGGGVVERFGLTFENLILTGSLQKGLGCYGGFVSGQAGMIDLLRVTSKSYIFSGALQPQAVSGGLKAIEICQSDEGQRRRTQLREMSLYLREELQKMGFDVPLGDSPIIPVKVGGDVRTLMAGRKLFDCGIYLNSVLYPAVPKGEGVLRISLTALHDEHDLGELLRAFAQLQDFWRMRSGEFRENFFYAREVLKAKIQGVHYLGL